MSATITQATDDIITMFKNAWEQTGAASEIATDEFVDVFYPNVHKDAITEVSIEWLRIVFPNRGSGRHAGIGNGTGRYRKQGLAFFQIFTVQGLGPDRANALSQLVVDTFEGKTSPNGVTFNETTVQEVSDESWNAVRVAINYEFDEFK